MEIHAASSLDDQYKKLKDVLDCSEIHHLTNG